MNKKILIVALVGIVIVGGIIYLKNTGKVESPAASSENAQNVVVPVSGGGMKSLRDLLALGTSQKCTYTQETGGTKSEGAVYVASGKMRSDSVSRVDANGKTILSHMIVDGDTMKMWQDGETMGFTMQIPKPGEAPVSNSDSSNTNAPNFENKTEYSCGAWSMDASVFEVPPNVAFHSMADMMKGGVPQGGGDTGMMEGMEPVNMDAGAAAGGVNAKAVQCRTCDQVTDPSAKAQCKATFQCE